MFNVHIQNKLLKCTPVTVPLSGTGKKGNEGGPPALEGTREYKQPDRGR